VNTERMNINPIFTKNVISKHFFDMDNFSLIDVGASGGIDSYWHVFLPDQLRAFGFEPLVKEVERLNCESPSPNIKYLPYFVTSPRAIKIEQQHNNNLFQRSSANRALSIMKIDYSRTYYDPSGDGKVSSGEITLDDFYAQNGNSNIDFIKIDTDGMDYAVLRGAERLLSNCVLGVGIECNFFGPIDGKANTFSNIDRLLRKKGFSLYDIEIHRYSKSILPKPFIYSIPAQTHGGQVMWGDALYLRDVASPDYENIWNLNISSLKILKLACLFEIFGLEDCAAELLITHESRIKALVDIEHCLNLLTPSLRGEQLVFKEYNYRFEKNIKVFFPDYNIRQKHYTLLKRIILSLGLIRSKEIKNIPILNKIAKHIYRKMINHENSTKSG
jgi:FkbM family methyltransferase